MLTLSRVYIEGGGGGADAVFVTIDAVPIIQWQSNEINNALPSLTEWADG